MTTLAAIALNRFGMGARPGDFDKIGRDPRDFLKAQVERAKGVPKPLQTLAGSIDYINAAPERGTGQEGVRAYRLRGRALYQQEIALRYAYGIATGEGFTERLVRFWSNHFTVSIANRQVEPFAGAMEREAIRPHLTGKFEDMLLAVCRHPAMLIYLDNANSFGPNSAVGRRRNVGLNENLAREILELHTLGVEGGYTQADVLALAKIITGWTRQGPQTRQAGVTGDAVGFVYLPAGHEPGDHVLLGKTYPETRDDAQGIAALKDLARHPSTARFIARKLATHFIADVPPARAVDALADVYARTGGDLKAVTLALVDLDEAWVPETRKFRAPEDFVVAGMRALSADSSLTAQSFVQAALNIEEGLSQAGDVMDPQSYQQALRTINRSNDPAMALLRTVGALGQYPFTAPSPAGWPDEASAWAGPDALIERLDWANAISARLRPNLEPVAFARAVLGPDISQSTERVLSGAASPAQGAALVLASPEFQRR